MPPPNKILVVDDEKNIRWIFKQALEKRNFGVDTAASGEEALEKIRTGDYLMVFSDIFLEEMNGLELLEQAADLNPDLKVVMMTAQDTMNNTIEAMRKGAYDYISKPFDFEEIYRLVERVVANRSIRIPQMPTAVPEEGFAVESIVGKCKKMQEVFKTIGKSAASDLAVLITGDSGTGKEMVARALHYYSRRAEQPFVCINCAAIARELLESELFGHQKGAFTGAVETKIGKFELAGGGTIFLDEIGDMEMSLQAKILRVLQSHEFYRVGGKEPVHVDVRVIAATNQDLRGLMEKNLFREDLFHRLNVIHIELPPLRERVDDIPLLANHFLRRFVGGLAKGQVYLAPEVERIFQEYPWPGNIRELENVVKRSLVLASSGPILPEHLPPQLLESTCTAVPPEEGWEERFEEMIREYLDLRGDWRADDDLYERLVQMLEKHLFQILLEKCSGKQVATAKVLGINRNTLKRKIDAMNLSTGKRGSKKEAS